MTWTFVIPDIIMRIATIKPRKRIRARRVEDVGMMINA
jgi:hypothetical protein